MTEAKTPRTITNPRWLSIQETADLIGVSTLTIRRWIGDKKLPARRVGPKLIRIDRHEVEKFMQPATAK